MEKKTLIGSIDLTPTWAQAVELIIIGLTNGTLAGKEIACTELRRMGRLLDEPEFTSVERATAVEVRRQRDLLVTQVGEMRALIQTIPSIILTARLDQVQKVETKYDYAHAAKACGIRVA